MSDEANFASIGGAELPYADEWKRTRPDYMVFHPAPDGRPRFHDDDFFVLNEETIPVQTKDGDLLMTWTAHGPGCRFQRIAVARSADGGLTWTEPVIVAGSKESSASAAWQVPIVAPSGRIYLFYCRYVPGPPWNWMSGRMCYMECRTTEDGGQSWDAAVRIPMKRRSIDHPDPEVPVAWIPWRQVEWDAQGRALLPFTRFDHSKASGARPREWCQCECMRFANIEDSPDPAALEIEWLPEADDPPITVPSDTAGLYWANEPNVIPLPDGRLFMSVRTRRGQVWYTLSEDEGASFRSLEVMRYVDGGEPILQPSDNAPIYRLQDGRYILLYHNNDGRSGGAEDVHDTRNRRPCYVSVGEFRPDAHQPLWWSAPKLFADIHDVGLDCGLRLPRYECIDYCGFTEIEGRRVLWYPDRKHWIVGKIIPDEWLANLAVPG
jgi:hypothetical protein